MCGFWRSATCARHPSCPEPPHRSRRPPGILPFSLRNRGQTQHFRQSTLRGCRDETSLSSRGSMRNLRQSQQLEEDEVEKDRPTGILRRHQLKEEPGIDYPTFTSEQARFPQRVQVVCSRRGGARARRPLIRHCHVFVHRRSRVSDPGTTFQGGAEHATRLSRCQRTDKHGSSDGAVLRTILSECDVSNKKEQYSVQVSRVFL